MKLANRQSLIALLLLTSLIGCSSNNSVQEQTARTESVEEQSVQDAAESKQDEVVQNAAESERLGTQWGDEVDSEVTMVDLRRTSENPIEEMQVRYADKDYAGRAVNSMSLVAGKVDFSVATDSGGLSIYRDQGNYFVRGQAGQAYRLVYQNNSDNTYEIVTSVDGINVLNGSAASRYDNGYVLDPNDQLVIEGFRKSQSAVASFIFSKPENAYAANTDAGSINNTGIIGTVVYELYDPTQPNSQQAFPVDDGYAKPPQ